MMLHKSFDVSKASSDDWMALFHHAGLPAMEESGAAYYDE